MTDYCFPSSPFGFGSSSTSAGRTTAIAATVNPAVTIENVDPPFVPGSEITLKAYYSASAIA
jgi:hypothetical protein